MMVGVAKLCDWSTQMNWPIVETPAFTSYATSFKEQSSTVIACCPTVFPLFLSIILTVIFEMIDNKFSPAGGSSIWRGSELNARSFRPQALPLFMSEISG